MIKCPLCNNKLIDYGKSYICEKRHTFDKNKNGFTNLLLVNKMHSLDPGDNKEMVEARVNFLATDKYQVLKNAIIEIIKENYTSGGYKILDIACGEGYYTNSIAKAFPQATIKCLDLSKYALTSLAKKAKREQNSNIEALLASLNDLPFLDKSFDLALNCFAPLNAKEFARVIKTNGIFIRVLPGRDHLKEMKEVLYENVLLNKPKEETLEGFELIKKKEVTDFINLNNEEINNLFKMTPYYYKTKKESSEVLLNLETLNVQIQFNLLIYKKI